MREAFARGLSSAGPAGCEEATFHSCVSSAYSPFGKETVRRVWTRCFKSKNPKMGWAPAIRRLRESASPEGKSVDEVERIISRLSGIDPERPYFDPLAVEEAISRHARLIGFRNVSFVWAMGPRQANGELEGVDFDSSESGLWAPTTQAMRDQAMAELQHDEAVLRRYREARAAAEERLAHALHLGLFKLTFRDVLSGEAGARGYNVSSLVSAVLRDVIASSRVSSGGLEDLNEAYLPFAEAMTAGLGFFWIYGERFICLPLPRLSLEEGAFVGGGRPAAVWPNGEAYAQGKEGLVPVLQTVEW